MNRLILVGASGHGKVAADIAKLNGYTDVVFLDDRPVSPVWAGCPVLGTSELLDELEGDVFISIGNADARRRLMLRHPERRFPLLIHPAATVAQSARIGAGTAIMAGAVVNPDAVLGRGCIVNTAASVDHDCTVGDFVHVAVGARLCGTVAVGEGSWIGAGAVVSNNVTVCGGCTVGAGAVVVRSIREPGVYVGVPARRRAAKKDDE